MSMESTFKRIASLIDSGRTPKEASETYDNDEEEKKKKRYLNKSKTKRFMDSFSG